MRVIAALALSALAVLAMPRAAAAQAEIVVFVVPESPLRELLDIELAARGLRARFDVPEGESYRARTVSAGAAGALWLEDASSSGVTVLAFRSDRGTSARLSLPAMAGEVDPRVVSVVAAALLEELLAAPAMQSVEETVQAESAEVVPPPPAPPAPVAAETPEEPARPRTMGVYASFDVGLLLRFVPGPDPGFAARHSVGIAWRDGLRLGVVIQFDAYALNDGPLHGYGVHTGAGLESGASIDDGIVSLQFGAQALVALGRLRNFPQPNGQPVGVVGAYVGLGLWATPRFEIRLRVSGELWIEQGREVEPGLRTTLGFGWR